MSPHVCVCRELAGGGGSGALRPEPTTPLTPAAAQPAPAAADRLPQRDSAAHRRVDRLLPQLQRAGPGSRVTPRHPPLRGTTAVAFGFNKPLEIVKPKVSGGGRRLCCVWSLIVKLIQCKLNPASAHGAVLSAAAPNDQSAKSAYPVQWRF